MIFPSHARRSGLGDMWSELALMASGAVPEVSGAAVDVPYYVADLPTELAPGFDWSAWNEITSRPVEYWTAPLSTQGVPTDVTTAYTRGPSVPVSAGGKSWADAIGVLASNIGKAIAPGGGQAAAGVAPVAGTTPATTAPTFWSEYGSWVLVAGAAGLGLLLVRRLGR